MTKTDRFMNRFGRGAAALALCLATVPNALLATEKPEKADGVRTVYLIRHGEYDHDDERDPEVGKARGRGFAASWVAGGGDLTSQ